MTFMRDWEIHKRCQPPTGVIAVFGKLILPTEAGETVQFGDKYIPTWSDAPYGAVEMYRARNPSDDVALFAPNSKEYEDAMAAMYPGGWKPMIAPFHPEQIRTNAGGNKIPSIGLSSAGYDISLQPKFKLFVQPGGIVIDPLVPNEDYLMDVVGNSVVIPPGGYLLGVTNEYFSIPRDVVVIALGKSTMARAGAVVNVTPLEPEWEGELVVEIANPTPCPLRITANVGIAQLMFDLGSDCKVSYRDRGGKYMHQKDIVAAKL